MAQKTKQWGAIIVMIALFAMIAFVTNLCTPMATIIKNQGEISNVLAQIGNYGNFFAYLFMGIPAGMLIAKFGYKKTALIGLVVGIVGILIQWLSGQFDPQENLGLVFGVYLVGALIAGLCMAILNCVVNPMLNLLGGGGNSGNQLIQIGGVFNSSAAVACYILMGALIADASKAKIADATPALFIALAIFVIAFIVILFTKIEEPEQAPVRIDLISGAMSHRHFALGALAIFLYMGIEVGVPNAVQQMLTSAPYSIPAATVGMIVAVYWAMMLVGRLVGASIGAKVSARAMLKIAPHITDVHRPTNRNEKIPRGTGCQMSSSLPQSTPGKLTSTSEGAYIPKITSARVAIDTVVIMARALTLAPIDAPTRRPTSIIAQ